MRDELRRTLRGATHRGDGAEVVEALRDVDVRDYLPQRQRAHGRFADDDTAGPACCALRNKPVCATP
jgi:hypothetical protein